MHAKIAIGGVVDRGLRLCPTGSPMTPPLCVSALILYRLERLQLIE